MNKKTKIVVVSIFTFWLLFGLINSSVFATSKQHLAQLVMEHESKIDILEELVKNLDPAPKTNESLTTVQKEALLKEVEKVLPSTIHQWNMETDESVTINVPTFDIKEKNGRLVLQLFTEGEYNWTDLDGNSTWEMGPGRKFATGIIRNFDLISKMYGINLTYEFYQNGERIQIFTNIE